MAVHPPAHRHDGSSQYRRYRSYRRRGLIDSYRPRRYSSPSASESGSASKDFRSRHQGRSPGILRQDTNSRTPSRKHKPTCPVIPFGHRLLTPIKAIANNSYASNATTSSREVGRHPGVFSSHDPKVMTKVTRSTGYTSLPSIEEINQEFRNLALMADDENSGVAPYTRLVKYNLDVELASDTIVLHPQFMGVAKVAKAIMGELGTLLGIDYYPSDSWGPLRKEVKDHMNPYGGEQYRIGFAGNSGEGKSRLIGSLLGDTSLVQYHDSGNSCTKTPIEYTYRIAHHKFVYLAVVTYKSWEKIEAMLESCLTGLTFVWEHENQDKIEAPARRRRDTAEDVLSALFPLDPGFYAEESFNQLGYNECLSRLKIETRSIHDALPRDRNPKAEAQFTIRAATTDELWQKLMPFTHARPVTNRASARKGTWPLVEVARIETQSPALRCGAVWVDAPGIDDFNEILIDAADVALRRCDTILVVNQIRKVGGQDRVRRHLEDCIKKSHRKVKVGLVLTCTDIIDLKRSHEAAFDDDEYSVLSKLYELKEKLKEYEAEIGTNRGADFWRGVEKMKPYVDFRIKELLIHERNRRMKEAARSWFPARIPQGDREVFCVSAKEYDKGTTGYDILKEPALSAQGTGVPELWRFLVDLPSVRRQRQLRAYIQVTSPSIWTSFRLSCERLPSGPNNQNEILQEIDQTLQVCLDIASIGEEFDQMTHSLIATMRQLEDDWVERATSRWKVWTAYNPRSFKAFIKARGMRHSTPSVSATCWNEELLEVVRKDLSPTYDTVEDIAYEMLDTMARHLCEALDNLASSFLARDLPYKARELRLFRDSFELKQSDIINFVGLVYNRFQDGFLRPEKARATSNGDGAYLRRAMLPIYQEAGQHFKRKANVKMFDIRKQTLIDGITGPDGPYAYIRIETERRFRDCREAMQAAINRGLRHIFSKIKSEFQGISRESELKEESKGFDLLLKERRKAAIVAQRTLEEASRLLDKLGVEDIDGDQADLEEEEPALNGVENDDDYWDDDADA